MLWTCCALAFLPLLLLPSVHASLNISADVPSKTEHFRCSVPPACPLEDSGIEGAFPSTVQPMGVARNESSCVELRKANASKEMGTYRPANNSFNPVPAVDDHAALEDEETRGSTQPRKPRSPVHTAAEESVERHHSHASSIGFTSVPVTETELNSKLGDIALMEPDLSDSAPPAVARTWSSDEERCNPENLKKATVMRSELREATPPPRPSSPIHTATGYSIAHTTRAKSHHSSAYRPLIEERFPENLKKATLKRSELRGATPPPRPSSPIHTATGYSIAHTTRAKSRHSSAYRPLVDITAIGRLPAELRITDAHISMPTMSQLRSRTPPPRPSSPIHTAAGDSIARDKLRTSNHPHLISFVTSNNSHQKFYRKASRSPDVRSLSGSEARVVGLGRVFSANGDA